MNFNKEDLELSIKTIDANREVLSDEVADLTIMALERLLASEEKNISDFDQQRKLVTILFLDVVDSTTLFGSLDPEENMTIMDTALQKLSVPIADYGGRVTRFMGDGFLAIFGLPTTRENDPEIAIKAALKVIGVANEIAKEIEADWKIGGFQVRIGINTGLVVTGGMTEAEDTLMGSSVNLASRLEAQAPPGEILISENTCKLVKGIFNLRKIEAIEIKGFKEPVDGYIVESIKPTGQQKRNRGVEGSETAFVGRQSELELLGKKITEVRRTKSNILVTIVGDAGLGKTRLLSEFEKMITVEGEIRNIFRARALQETKDKPYGLIRNLFANQFQLSDDDPLDTVRTKFVRGFRDILGDQDELISQATFVGHLLGYDFQENELIKSFGSNAKQLKELAFLYLMKFFHTHASQHMVIIEIEDVQWGDQSSLDTISGLTDLLNLPILILLTSRVPIEGQFANGTENQLHIKLEPLSDVESTTLIRKILYRVEHIPDVLLNLVVTSGNGNPYYIEELIKMLLDEKVIMKDSTSWEVQMEKLEELQVPSSLTGVLQARLDSLPPDEKRILQQAAVIGRVFWDQMISHLNSSEEIDERRISELLKRLSEKELIDLRALSVFAHASEYYFKNSLFRDVAYETVLIRERQIYHQRIAEWMIQHGEQRANQFSGTIAKHYEQAGLNELALQYYCNAAEIAANKFAIIEADFLYSKALHLCPEDDYERRYTLLIGREELTSMKGDRNLQLEIIGELITLSKKMNLKEKRIEVMIKQVWYWYWTTDYEKMHNAAIETLEYVDKETDKTLVHELNYALAWSSLLLERSEEAISFANVALSISKQFDNKKSMGNSLNILGLITLNQGDFYAASKYLEKFLTISRETNDRNREITALTNLGTTYMKLGKFEEAELVYRDLLKVAEKTGDKVALSSAFVNLAWVLNSRGSWEDGCRLGEKAITLKEEVDHLDGLAEVLVWLGHSYLETGQYEKSRNAYTRAMKIRAEQNHEPLFIEARAGLVRLAIAEKKEKEASQLNEAITTFILDDKNIASAWEPARIYLTCYNQLKSDGDSRAENIFGRAINSIQHTLELIPEDIDREAFNSIPWNRELIDLSEKLL